MTKLQLMGALGDCSSGAAAVSVQAGAGSWEEPVTPFSLGLDICCVTSERKRRDFLLAAQHITVAVP